MNEADQCQTKCHFYIQKTIESLISPSADKDPTQFKIKNLNIENVPMAIRVDS